MSHLTFNYTTQKVTSAFCTLPYEQVDFGMVLMFFDAIAIASSSFVGFRQEAPAIMTLGQEAIAKFTAWQDTLQAARNFG
jgi:hypothetical protein